VNARKAIDIPGSATLILNPRYDVDSQKADVGVTYAVRNTSVNIDSESKKITLAQLVGDKNVVMPSISLGGKFDIAVQRSFDFGKIITTIKPEDAVNIKWEQGPYVATINAPIENNGLSKFEGIDVSLKTRVDF